ncbi:MAG: vanadium-dependent haloperoxidase [Ignavibacteria bacterium]
MYFNASAQNLASIDSLEDAFNTTYQTQVSSEIFSRSKIFGENIASAIYNWSVTDGGNEGQLHNTDPGYVPPAGTGYWVPTPPSNAPAVQPYWGNNRPFITANVNECQPGPHAPFSTSNTSLFYTQALEVYSTSNKLTEEQETIALFWADDGGTYTPPGHSVAILMQLLNTGNYRLDFSAASLAKIGIAVSDAFISCWKGKFTYNLLRPITYIRNYIDPSWSPFVTTPAFPEYASGHSTQSGASAQVLSDILGYNYSFTDYTHTGDGFAPRSFNSFFDFADEAAISRLYGGIHYRSANENGLDKGIEIGRNVSALHFQK